VVRGEIFDVAVDLRPASVTWGRWQGHLLSADRGEAMWIPPGMAHGYYVTGQVAEVGYLVTAPWDPASEITVRWDDPAIGIDWPLNGAPLLSERDASAPVLDRIDFSALEVQACAGSW